MEFLRNFPSFPSVTWLDFGLLIWIMDYFQEECRKLQAKAEDLAKETSNLRAGIMRVSKECRKLKKENKSIMKGLEKMYGPDAVGDLKAEEPGSVTGDGESSSDESGNETLHEPYLWAIFCMYI
nr:G-box-binding factor 1-like [Ziziphus jujuba var. spinosa]